MLPPNAVVRIRLKVGWEPDCWLEANGPAKTRATINVRFGEILDGPNENAETHLKNAAWTLRVRQNAVNIQIDAFKIT
jgi:hypothetical protein